MEWKCSSEDRVLDPLRANFPRTQRFISFAAFFSPFFFLEKKVRFCIFANLRSASHCGYSVQPKFLSKILLIYVQLINFDHRQYYSYFFFYFHLYVFQKFSFHQKTIFVIYHKLRSFEITIRVAFDQLIVIFPTIEDDQWSYNTIDKLLP